MRELDPWGFFFNKSEVTGTSEVPVTSTQQSATHLNSAAQPYESLEAGKSYYYWLEDIDLNGQTSLHGPVSATVNEPTAVTLEELSIEMPTISLWGLMAFMLTH